MGRASLDAQCMNYGSDIPSTAVILEQNQTNYELVSMGCPDVLNPHMQVDPLHGMKMSTLVRLLYG